jgi:hypothetical protein
VRHPHTFQTKIPLVTFGDTLLIGILLCLSVLSFFIHPGGRFQGVYGIIESEGHSIRRLKLSKDQEVSIRGPLGETIVEVHLGCIRVKESPCPHQLCVQMGCQRRDGACIACIPNKVVVRVEGGTQRKALDGVTR